MLHVRDVYYGKPDERHPDDRLPSLGSFISELAGAACVEPQGDGEGRLMVSEMAFDLPFELELMEDAGAWQLGAAPPTQKVETTVMPVWHRVRLRVRLDDDERGVGALES
jgi:hypothetical protein